MPLYSTGEEVEQGGSKYKMEESLTTLYSTSEDVLEIKWYSPVKEDLLSKVEGEGDVEEKLEEMAGHLQKEYGLSREDAYLLAGYILYQNVGEQQRGKVVKAVAERVDIAEIGKGEDVARRYLKGVIVKLSISRAVRDLEGEQRDSALLYLSSVPDDYGRYVVEYFLPSIPGSY